MVDWVWSLKNRPLTYDRLRCLLFLMCLRDYYDIICLGFLLFHFWFLRFYDIIIFDCFSLLLIFDKTVQLLSQVLFSWRLVTLVLFIFQVGQNFYILVIYALFLVSDRSKVNNFQPLIILICKLFKVVYIFRWFSNFECFISSLNLKVIFATKLNDPLFTIIINNNKYLLVAEWTELYCFLKKASFSLAEGYISLHLAFDKFEFVYLFFAHCCVKFFI